MKNTFTLVVKVFFILAVFGSFKHGFGVWFVALLDISRMTLRAVKTQIVRE